MKMPRFIEITNSINEMLSDIGLVASMGSYNTPDDEGRWWVHKKNVSGCHGPLFHIVTENNKTTLNVCASGHFFSFNKGEYCKVAKQIEETMKYAHCRSDQKI